MKGSIIMSANAFEKIKEGLAGIGVKPGDDLLIHSSFKSLGYVEGGIKTFVEAVISYLGDRGTLLMPALTYANVTPLNPVFDVRDTKSCVGAVSEFFRTYDGVRRSINATHSVCAYGFKRDEYVGTHINDDCPIGENSPLYKLHELGGKILMVGCSLRPNTSMHGVETKAGAPYILSDETRTYTLIDENDKKIHKDMRYHTISLNGFRQRYDRIEGLIDVAKGNILEAECFLMNSADVWKAGVEKIHKDTYFFVDKIEE